jgi:arylsulfatase A
MQQSNRSIMSCALTFGLLILAACGQEPDRPNIIFIMADDLGYGDVSCLNPDSKIQTPHMDALASEGILFSDAHSGAALCTPTRYGVLTGRYAWRSRLKSSVLWGYSPPLIEEGRETVASLLGQLGYRTGCVGKWHLGLGWQTTNGVPPSDDRYDTGAYVDFTKPIQRGPVDLGFDYFFGIPASLDMVPYVYIEDDRVTALPSDSTEGRPQSGEDFWRPGPIAPDFTTEGVLPKITEKALAFIEDCAGNNADRPFFLYFPLSAPHTPVLPVAKFQGRSQSGAYGDFVMQIDWIIGQVVETVDQLGQGDNTLIIVTSDNGPETYMLSRIEKYNHVSSGRLRGMKRDTWEGGHRVPFFARWPGRIAPGTQSGDVICLTDLLATALDLVGVAVPQDAGEDSYSIVPALLGTSDKPVREATVHHSGTGEFAIRQGKWKLILCQGSGGNHYPEGPNAVQPDDPPGQLYNMNVDVSERRNLYNELPDVVERLTRLLDTYKHSGRSATR